MSEVREEIQAWPKNCQISVTPGIYLFFKEAILIGVWLVISKADIHSSPVSMTSKMRNPFDFKKDIA
ncbi:MAG: hypothetical protein GTO17_09220 [Candidatus Aminicenantes bacterium]|nr:hypothetical protein [Candidatus Aminicenantes bacterium]